MRIYEYQTELLVKCGYRVVTVDVRGFEIRTLRRLGTVTTSLQMISTRWSGLLTWDVLHWWASALRAIALRYMKRYEGYGVKRLILLGAAV